MVLGIRSKSVSGTTGLHAHSLIGVRAALLTEFSALHPSATQQLSMLLLGHALTPLLDD